MEKTKFIRVAVEERLPNEAGEYNTEVGTVLFSQKMKSFLSYQGDVIQIDWFLEEMPDREDEMLQMLEKCKKSLDWVFEYCTLPTFYNEEQAEEQTEHIGFRRQELFKLIQSVKQTK